MTEHKFLKQRNRQKRIKRWHNIKRNNFTHQKGMIHNPQQMLSNLKPQMFKKVLAYLAGMVARNQVRQST